MSEQLLIARWVVPHPHRPGVEHMVLAESGRPVWAIIGDFTTTGEAMLSEIPTVAADYALPEEAVRAAVLYYFQHQPIFDNKLQTHRAEPVSPYIGRQRLPVSPAPAAPSFDSRCS